MDGHDHALGGAPAGGKVSGMMCACMSTIIAALPASSGARVGWSRGAPLTNNGCYFTIGPRSQGGRHDLVERDLPWLSHGGCARCRMRDAAEHPRTRPG